MGENTQDGTPGSWFRVTIPCAIKYDKTWLMKSIQSHCSVPFTPVDFHFMRNGAQFFVQEASTASALMDVSYKIRDEESRKIPVFVSPSAVPYSVRDKLKPEEMEQLKLTLSKRFDVSQQALDLRRLRLDPDLVCYDIDIFLNRRNCMAATLQVIEKYFPELSSLNLSSNKLYQLDGLSDITQMAPTVKILNLSKNELTSVWELSKMQGLKLEELWLQGNPLCDTFPDQSTYVRSPREYHGTGCAPGPCGSPADTGQLLQSPTTHCCSLSPRSSLCEYFKDSRNMKKLKHPYLRVQLLKHTKRVIVHTLCVLPKTQHAFSSFVVDTWFQTVSACFLPRVGPGSRRGAVVCLLLKWKEVLRAVCVPSPGPSSLPLPATPGESPVVGGNAHPRLDSGAWECGGADLRFTQ
uniref:Nuclear RNA export factor Tap RNA-binding domain-containing protein n=1 Tax=Phocoena sinus TaxID=42100 RepID=A0A8C9C5V9_PHOSS